MKKIQVFLPQGKKISSTNIKNILNFLMKKKKFFSVSRKKEVVFTFNIALNKGIIETFFEVNDKDKSFFVDRLKESEYFLLKNDDTKLNSFDFVLKTKSKNNILDINISKEFLNNLINSLNKFSGNKKNKCTIQFEFLQTQSKKIYNLTHKEIREIKVGDKRFLGKFRRVVFGVKKYQLSNFDKKNIERLENNFNTDLYYIRINAFASNKFILSTIKDDIYINTKSDDNFIKTKIKKKNVNLEKYNNRSLRLLGSEKQLSNLFYVNNEYYTGNIFGLDTIPKEYITKEENKKFGVGSYKGQETGFFVPFEKLFLHTLLCGSTGSGKTIQLIRQFLADMHYTGDQKMGGLFFDISPMIATKEIIARIPKNRLKDVVVLDTFKPNFYFDFFGKFKGETEETQINRIVDMVNELISEEPKALNVKRFIYPIIVLAVKNKIKISEIHKIKDKTFLRKNIHLLDAQNQEKFRDFLDNGKKLTELDPIFRRLDHIASNKTLVKILSEKQGIKFDILDFMQKNKIVIIAMDVADKTTQATLQAIVISAIRNATFSANITKKPFTIYLDEFNTFNSSDSMDMLLTMARKYRISLNLGIQHFGQLGKLKEVVFGNVNNVFILNENAFDRSIIHALLDKKDLDFGKKYDIFVRLDGRNTVKIKMLPLDEPIRSKEEVKKILEESIETENTPKKEVKKEKILTEKEVIL